MTARTLKSSAPDQLKTALQRVFDAFDAAIVEQADALETLACELTGALCPEQPGARVVLNAATVQKLLGLLYALESKQNDLIGAVVAIEEAADRAQHRGRPGKG